VHGTALAVMIDGDLEAERIAEALFQCGRVGILYRSGARLARDMVSHQLFHLSDIESARDDLARQRLGIGVADERTGVAGGKFAAADECLHRFRKLEKAQHVGDMAAALADDPSDLVLVVFELPTERLLTGRFFERIEVFALDVLDDRQFQCFGIADIEDDDGNVVDAGALRGPPTALAGNDLESA